MENIFFPHKILLSLLRLHTLEWMNLKINSTRGSLLTSNTSKVIFFNREIRIRTLSFSPFQIFLKISLPKYKNTISKGVQNPAYLLALKHVSCSRVSLKFKGPGKPIIHLVPWAGSSFMMSYGDRNPWKSSHLLPGRQVSWENGEVVPFSPILFLFRQVFLSYRVTRHASIIV